MLPPSALELRAPGRVRFLSYGSGSVRRVHRANQPADQHHSFASFLVTRLVAWLSYAAGHGIPDRTAGGRAGHHPHPAPEPDPIFADKTSEEYSRLLDWIAADRFSSRASVRGRRWRCWRCRLISTLVIHALSPCGTNDDPQRWRLQSSGFWPDPVKALASGFSIAPEHHTPEESR